MEFRKNENNQIVLNKKTSIQLEASDKFIFSPANKLIFVITPLPTSFTATAYDLKGVSKGSYEYKNAEFNKFCLRHGCANIVYCQTEPSGNKCWYQGKLIDNGYMTDLFALERTDANGLPIAMVDEAEEGEENTEVDIIGESSDTNNTEPTINEKVDDILAGLTPKEAEVFTTNAEETVTCANCGENIKATATFCPMCGAAQEK